MKPAAPAPTPEAPATTKHVSGPAPVAKGRAAPELPSGWGDTVHETSWTPPEQSAFGAATVDAPEGAATEQPFVPETVVEDPKAPKVETKTDDAETPIPEGDAPAEETTETAPAEEAPKVEPPAPESSSMLRRKALDALRVEGENRALQARLKAEQDARNADKASRDAELAAERGKFERLRSAPLEERLKAIGIETQDELFEAGISGKIKMPDQRETPAAAPADTERYAKLEAELQTLRVDAQIRAVMQQGGSATPPEAVKAEALRIWAQAGSPPGDQTPFLNQAITQILNHERATGEASRSIRDELAKADELPAPFVRATPGALDAVTAAAMVMWQSNGSKAGDFARCAKFCLESAEEMYAERDAQYEAARAARAGLKPAAPAPKTAAPAARPAPPIGKKVASRGAVEEDEGPMDPALRNLWVKEEMRKAGKSGW